MLIPNHPDDERLSALASRDDDAVADTKLTSHVATCPRCTELVSEIGALRVSLAELPDLAPHRPLRLLPPVADAPAAGGGGSWVRRLFAPAMTAGAALAMVGLIGTTAPLLGGMASSGAAPAQDSAAEGGAEHVASSFAQTLTTEEAAPAAEGGGVAAQSPDEAEDGESRAHADASVPASGEVENFYAPTTAGGDEDLDAGLTAERSPWPMVLFAGVALIIGALLLRWILVPRAG
jgi:hypothetical protein